MKKLIIFLLILITYLILLNSDIVISTVINTIDIFKKNIFPSLFPFFIISELLVNYGFVEFLSKYLKKFMNKFFKINSSSAFILIMSIISGFPSSSKYTKDLYLNGSLTKEEASKVLMFTHFSNPLFILGGISIFLNNKRASLIILIIHYSVNFIIGFLTRNIIDTPISNKEIKNNKKTDNFSNILGKAILNSFNTLCLILGTMIIFLILTNLLNEVVTLNPYLKSILNGILEMTGGISNISILNISLKNKATLIGMIISFGGLSVHMQIKSIISDTPIKYYPFFVARLLHSSLTGFLIFFLFDYLI